MIKYWLAYVVLFKTIIIGMAHVCEHTERRESAEVGIMGSQVIEDNRETMAFFVSIMNNAE